MSSLVMVMAVLSFWAVLNTISSVGCWASEEDQILIWIRDDKSRGAPWLLLQFLLERDSCSLATQKQLFGFARGGNRDGSGEQMFALANIAGEHRFADQPQVEACIVAEDLRVVWRIAINEFDREAELVCIEIAGTLDVRNEELRLNCVENRTRRWMPGFSGHDICS